MRHAAPAVRAAAVAVAVALVAAGCSDDSPAAGGTSTPTGSAATSLPPLPEEQPTTPPGEDTSDGPPPDTRAPSVAVSTRPPARFGTGTPIARGVLVTVGAATPVQLTASGPGEIAGDGVSVQVTVRNESGAAVSLDGFAVTATYGRDQPASPAGAAEPATTLAGRLAPGRTAKATYLFSVPRPEAGGVQVRVSSDASPDILTFRG